MSKETVDVESGNNKKLGGEKRKKVKTETKILAIVEIAIVLCSLFLVALPVVAADQNQEMQKVSASEVTTTSEDDYILEIYGNANEDDTIDMGDVVYTKLAIFGKKPKTELCDAKYDGRINVLDVIQTKLIILGKEKEITIIDSEERIVTVSKPLQRIVPLSTGSVEIMRSIRVADKILGVAKYITEKPMYFPEFGEYSIVDSKDPESILTLHPDIVILTPGSSSNPVADACEAAGITTIRFHCYQPKWYVEEIRKLGYIFDKKDEADEFLDSYEGWMNSIEEKVEGIPEEDKPRIYYQHCVGSMRNQYFSCGEGVYNDEIVAAGGHNVFEDLGSVTHGCVVLDPEEIMNRNPEIIVWCGSYFYGKGYAGYDLDAGDTTLIKAVREEVLNQPELQEVTAVKDKKVYIISQHIICCDGLSRHFVGIAYMAKWFHPELFEDLDPKQIHQEYLTRFQGLDIDLDEKGVFVYPEPS